MKNLKIEIRWAILITIAAVLWLLLEKELGYHGEKIAEHSLFGWLFVPVIFVLFIFALWDKRQNYYEGSMRWKQGFTSGVLIAVFMGILAPIVQILFHEVISPDYFEKARQYSIENTDLSEEAAYKNFNLIAYSIQSIVFSVLLGTGIAAIVALFLQNRKPKENA